MIKKLLSFQNTLSPVSHLTSLTIFFYLPCQPLLIFGMDTSMLRCPRTPSSGPVLSSSALILRGPHPVMSHILYMLGRTSIQRPRGHLLIMQSWFIKFAQQKNLTLTKSQGCLKRGTQGRTLTRL